MNPRYYQTAANDAAWQFLSEKPGNPLIVLPTGAGKSLVIAMLARQALEFGGRVVVLAHRKELLQQNAEKIRILLPGVDVGIFSAGLKSRETSQDVLCAGIQSVYRKASEIGPRHLVIVDEAHLISQDEDSMYGSFINDILAANPKARVTGLTATPYRTGEGPICGPDKLFRRICYEAQTGKLIAEGFLCPITNKAAESSVSTDSLAIRGGEFIEGDVQKLFGRWETVGIACQEIYTKTKDRHSVLIFASGVSHAESVAREMHELSGEPVGIVTGETLPIERAETLRRFRDQSLRWLVNCDVLTTGFDAPCIDAIAVLRATMSPGLFAQMVGRGLRKDPSKENTLVLDFGENIKRHGSLDDASYGRASSEASAKQRAAAEANGRGKPCPACGIDSPSKAPACIECGFAFPVKEHHGAKADDGSTLTGEYPPEQWTVESVAWGRHTKKGDPDAPPTLRVDYTVKPLEGGLIPKTVSEWVCFEHTGFARTKAVLWWQARSVSTVPETIEEALSLLNRGACRTPLQLITVRDGKYTRIKEVMFCDERPEEWAEEAEEVLDSFGEEVPF
jgi:DNA repair protein RadD